MKILLKSFNNIDPKVSKDGNYYVRITFDISTDAFPECTKLKFSVNKTEKALKYISSLGVALDERGPEEVFLDPEKVEHKTGSYNGGDFDYLEIKGAYAKEIKLVDYDVPTAQEKVEKILKEMN